MRTFLCLLMVNFAFMPLVLAADPPTAGLIAFYPFDGDANDASGNGNDGTLMGGATVTNDVLNIGNNAVDRLSLPSTVIDGLGDFTISAFIRIDDLQEENAGGNSSNTLVSGARLGEDNALIVAYDPRDANNHWLLRINETPVFFDSIFVEDLEWHHLAVRRSAGNASVYLDGTQVGTDQAVSSDLLDIDPTGFPPCQHP